MVKPAPEQPLGQSLASSRQDMSILRAERDMFAHPALRCVVCNSEMVREEIVRYYAVPRDKLAVIRNGIDLQRFRPPAAQEREAARTQLDWPQDRTVFLFVGSGFERKGVRPALRAFARAALAQRALLVIVGHDKRNIFALAIVFIITYLARASKED